MENLKESVIEYFKGDSTATVTAYSGSHLKRRILELRENPKIRIVAENQDGSILAHIPVEWLRINPPRAYTEEQKAEMSERAKRNFGKA